MQPVTTVDEDEYLSLERVAREKHELVNGQIVAMSGASPRHNAICANLIAALRQLLRSGPCSPLTSDQRVRIEATGLYTYPDVTVVCGEARYHTKDSHSLVTPTLLVEVLSPTTEAYDRGAKLHHYQTIPSLREYLIVASEERSVDHYRRIESNRWELSSYANPGDLIELPALSVRLPFAEIYEGTERFPL